MNFYDGIVIVMRVHCHYTIIQASIKDFLKITFFLKTDSILSKKRYKAIKMIVMFKVAQYINFT
jgi:hypothetical protein